MSSISKKSNKKALRKNSVNSKGRRSNCYLKGESSWYDYTRLLPMQMYTAVLRGGIKGYYYKIDFIRNANIYRKIMIHRIVQDYPMID